jgi:hypothetical protein
MAGSDASEAVDGVRAIRSLDIGSNLLANGRIGSVVDEVEVEGLSVGVDISPLDSERVRNLDISTLLGLGDMESSNKACQRHKRQNERETHGVDLTNE